MVKGYIIEKGKKLRRALRRNVMGAEFGGLNLEDEALRLIEERSVLKGEIKERETLLTLCEDKIKGILGENEELAIGDRLITFKRYVRKSVNLGELRNGSPEVYQMYLREYGYRRLEIK